MKGNQSKEPTVPGVYRISAVGGSQRFASWRGYWALTCGTPKMALVETDRSEDLYHQNFTWVFEQPLAPLGKWKANIHHTMLNVFMDKVVWGLPLDPIGQFDTKALEQGLVGMYELAQPETAATSPTETRRPGLYSLKENDSTKSYAVFLDDVWFAEATTRSLAVENAKRGVLMADSVKKLSRMTALWSKNNLFNEFVANRALKKIVSVSPMSASALVATEHDIPTAITRYEQVLQLAPGVYKVEGGFSPSFYCAVDDQHRYLEGSNVSEATSFFQTGVPSPYTKGACRSQVWTRVAPLPSKQHVSVVCAKDPSFNVENAPVERVDSTHPKYITPEPLPGGELQMHEGVPHYYGVRKDQVVVASECEFTNPAVGSNAHIVMEQHPHRHVLVLHNHTARHLSDAPLKMVHDADGTLGAVVVEVWLKVINANGDEKRVEPGVYRVAEFNIMCEKLARRSVQHWSL